MSELPAETLHGRRLLVAEDEYLIAADLASTLEDLGVKVIGPVASVDEALELVRRDGDQLDGAVLDINLRNQRIYPVAHALAARGVPFIFTTGYDRVAIPDPYATAPRCDKPVDKAQLVRCLLSAGSRK